MTAQVLEFRPRSDRGPAPLIRTTLPAASVEPWWTCPSWCDNTCFGGETAPFGRSVQIVPRLHQGVIYRTDNGANIGPEVSILVRVAVTEYHDGGYEGAPTVDVDISAVLTPDAIPALNAALEQAAVIAGQPLPALTPRPLLQGGGRASTPLEAS